jgi:hypothetical protein
MHLKCKKTQYNMPNIIVQNSLKMVFNLIFIFILILDTGYYTLEYYNIKKKNQ